ncbi:MAG: hypothetical protein ACKVQR_09470 [Aquabacterium sp.]
MAHIAPALTVKQRTRTQEVLVEWKGAGPKFKAAAMALNSAIVTGDLLGMKDARGNLERHLSQLSNIAGQAGFIQKSVRELTETEGFVDTAGAAVVILEQMDSVAEAASGAYAAGKRLIEKADKAIDTAEKGGADFEKKWAKANAYLEVHSGYRPAALKDMLAVVAAAEKALAARDAKALAKAQRDAAAFPRFATPMFKLRELLDMRRATVDQAPEEDRKSYEADIKSWADRLRQAEADEMQIALEKDAIAAMAIEPLDARKAAKVLAIDPAHVPKLAKVLEAEPSMLMKGLETLRKQLSLAMPARDMMLALQKARLV